MAIKWWTDAFNRTCWSLALDPEVLIIDEPVAQLDPQHATEIYDKLKYLNEELGKTIIAIEHHTEFIANYCNQVALN